VTQESFQRVINVHKRFAKTNDALLAEGRDGGEVRLGIVSLMTNVFICQKTK